MLNGWLKESGLQRLSDKVNLSGLWQASTAKIINNSLHVHAMIWNVSSEQHFSSSKSNKTQKFVNLETIIAPNSVKF